MISLILNYLTLGLLSMKYENSHKRLALSTFVKLLRATEVISSTVHGPLTDLNLTISQFGVLEALYHLGTMCQRDLAKKILKSTGNLTTVIDNLEKRKLVRRKRNENDRRYFDVSLTPKGENLIKEIFPEHSDRIVKEMDYLTKSEQKQLGLLCKKLVNKA